MSAICLSLAPILRCVSLDRLQSAVLLVPPGIEVCFCLVLMFYKRNSSDMKHTLLAAEGLTYSLWTVLDFLTHIIPAARSTLHIFKTLDIVLGSLAFAPLLLYTSFLFLAVQSELLQTIPIRLQSVTRYTLLVLIPMILVANAVGSFVGISYRDFSQGPHPLLAVGFLDSKAQFLWMFFSNLTLALLTSYQALAFLLFLCRAANVTTDQKRLESMGGKLQDHMFRGVLYMVLGVKMGTIETAVGFAGGGFGYTITRRILRLLGRALLITGFLKGWDSLEDFQSISKRGPRGMILISNPQYSTFRHVENGDPESTMFQHLRTLTVGSTSISAPNPNLGVGSRVTVHFPRGRAPTLHVRLSDLDPISDDLEEPPKSAPTRIYETPIPEDAPPSPYTPPPFSDLMPISKRRSALTVAKGMMTKARNQYHRYSRSSTFDTQNSTSSQYRFPPVNFNSPNNSPARDSKSMRSSQLLNTVVEGGGRSRVSSASGMWLGRHVNRTQGGVDSRRESERSVFSDPALFIQLTPKSTAPSQDGRHLTSRWTPSTEHTSSAMVSRQSHNQQSENSHTEETISWIGSPLSKQNSDNSSRSQMSSSEIASSYKPNSERRKTRITSIGAAPLRSTPEPTENIHSRNKSMVIRVESSEDGRDSIGTSTSESGHPARRYDLSEDRHGHGTTCVVEENFDST